MKVCLLGTRPVATPGRCHGRSARDVANGSVQAHFLPDDTCDESAARGRIVEESTDAGPDRPVDASVGCGRQGVGVSGPDIDARDLVGVAPDEPTKGCESRFNGKRRVRPGEVAGRPSQRLRIARPRVGESDRLVEQLRILRGGEPLALLTGRVTNEIRQDDRGWSGVGWRAGNDRLERLSPALLVKSVDRGEWTTVAGFRAAKARHARSAAATLRRLRKA